MIRTEGLKAGTWQSDTTEHHVKNLDVMLGSASAALVMDDTLGVWPPALQPNLLHVPRYVLLAIFEASRLYCIST